MTFTRFLIFSSYSLTVKIEGFSRSANPVAKRELSAIAAAISEDNMLKKAVFSAVDTFSAL
jgi:hypothetical protein